MRVFPTTLVEIIESSDFTLNAISKASGVSNTYLTKLVKGRINHPGKDKIASILLGLNYSITAINTVLADYDYLPLSQPDIPDIMENNSRRKVVGGILPYYDHIYIELHLCVLEAIGGTKLLIKNRPSGIFVPDELYMAKEFPFERDDEAEEFLYHLTFAAMRERKALFAHNHERGERFETYMCRHCLDEYIQRNLSETARKEHPERAKQVLRFFANALSVALKRPEQHIMHVVERCPYFHCQLQDADSESPIVSFPGRKPHSYDNPHDKWNLEGFSSNSPSIIAMFKREFEQCRSAAIADASSEYPTGWQKYLEKAMATHGIEAEFAEALQHLMSTPALLLY